MPECKIGQKLFYAPHDKRDGKKGYATISKIGRKWIEFNEVWMARADISTLAADGGKYSSRGRYYLTEDEYQQICEKNKAWDNLRQSFPIYAPKHLSLQQIKGIAALIAGEFR